MVIQRINKLDRSKIFACYFDVDSSPCDTVRIDRPTMDGHVGLEPQESIKFALASRNTSVYLMSAQENWMTHAYKIMK